MRLSAVVVALGAVFLLLTGFRPNTLPYVPGASFSDAAISHLPAAAHLRASILERREFPIWRDTIMAGQPFAANPLNKTAYPLQWLVLLLPAALHLDVMIVLHMALAGWGMWAWARSLGLRPEAAALSALAYALSPRLIAHTGAGHLDILYGLAWWAWLMRAVREAVTAEQFSPLAFLKVAVFAALVFLSDVRLSLFALGIAAAYGVYEAARAGALSRLARFAPVLPLFLALTASVVVPLLEWRPFLSRGSLTPRDAGIYSLGLSQFGGLLGLPLHSGTHELLTYVGVPVLILAVIAVVAQPRRILFWVALIVLAALYALGINGVLWATLVRLVPGLLWFRVPSRAWLVVAFVMPLLAGYGTEALLAWFETHPTLAPLRARRWQLVALAGVVGFLAAALFMLAGTEALRRVSVAMLAGAGLSLLLFLVLTRRLALRPFALALLAVTFVDLAWYGSGWLMWRGSDAWLAPHTALAERLRSENPARIYAPFYFVSPNLIVNLPQEAAAAYGLRLFGGIDPFQLTGVAEAVQQGSGIRARGYDVVLPPLLPINPADPQASLQAITPDTRVLGVWGVSHVASVLPLAVDRLELVDQVDDTFIYRNLDYQADTLNRWGWVPGWQNLPDEATIESLNGVTFTAALVSGALFLACVAILVGDTLARRRRAAAVG